MTPIHTMYWEKILRKISEKVEIPEEIWYEINARNIEEDRESIMDYNNNDEEWEISTRAYTYTQQELRELYEEKLKTIKHLKWGMAYRCKICHRILPYFKPIYSCNIIITPT